MNNFLLDVLSFGAILSSILVITSKNPVVAVIFLISLFINTAGYLILLGIGFIGISYIIIYIGAITVLFLFIIMMINIRLLDILEIGNEYTKNLPLALLVGTLFVYEIFNVLPFTINNVFILDLPLEILNFFNTLILEKNLDSTERLTNLSDFFLALDPRARVIEIQSGNTDIDNILSSFSQIEVVGQGLYTYGAMLLLLSSVILLLSMVSAIFLSKNLSDSSYL
uniref:NADH dehydrogenase subunit 6 n=1 Tax=Auricularia delicata TaxID=160860 RepID=UPI0020792C9C|nr:NADH dehydrogenase subunit 6 [Auricularia delicata]URP31155.1 NADH dehydrogenase subunit 6 [Auricularia delicata]